MALAFEAVGRCAQVGSRRNLAATTTSPGGSSHDQLPYSTGRFDNCDPDHAGQLGGSPGDGAPYRPRSAGSDSQDRLSRLIVALSAASDRPSARPLRQPDRSWSACTALHPGTLTAADQQASADGGGGRTAGR